MPFERNNLSMLTMLTKEAIARSLIQSHSAMASSQGAIAPSSQRSLKPPKQSLQFKSPN